MSKQSEAKEKQGYVTKALCCGGCQHLKWDMVLPVWMETRNNELMASGREAEYDKSHKVEKNLRCGLGGFAVKKSGACRAWKVREVK